jgi:hypothetical protein
MNFLNLGIGELLGLAGVISAGVLALYLLDRSKRRVTVATLRFWNPGQAPTELKRARRVHQPWSLLLQILSILLLLLAIAGPQIGNFLNNTRDHVVILDTSAWMGARARQGVLLDQAKTQAIAYVNALPSGDRVMLVRADALATPVTPFETNHQAVIQAIQQSQPGSSALNLSQALDFAEHAQNLQAERTGEIVFAGAGRVPAQDAEQITTPKNLRLLNVPTNSENVGLRKLGLRRPAGTSEEWEAFVAVRNDSVRAREVNLDLTFGGSPAGSKLLKLAAGGEAQETFRFRATAGGYLEARLRPTNKIADAFPQDDRAVLELPASKTLKVHVYSDSPELLRPLITSNLQVDAEFDPIAKYGAAEADGKPADIVILDRFAPPQAPTVNTIWIEPPVTGSPFKVRPTTGSQRLERWRSDSPVAAGLYTKDLELNAPEAFDLAEGDQAVAETSQGAVILSRTGKTKSVAMGFHPVRSSMRYELATPLLMANVLRWMAPESFRRWDVQAGTVGTVTVPIDRGVDPATIRVVDENQKPVPFTLDANSLHFFSGAPGTVRLLTGDRETVYSLTLPDVAEVLWKPEGNVRKGIPARAAAAAAPPDIWPWLAVLGGIGFLVDWLLYGRRTMVRINAGGSRIIPRKQVGSFMDRLPWRKAS